MALFSSKKYDFDADIAEMKESKQNQLSLEEKSSGNVDHVSYLLSTFGGGILVPNVSPTVAYNFYHKIAPLQGTVSKIHDAISDLPLVLKDEREPDQLIKESEILTLLNNPSKLTTKKQFFTSAAQSIMLTRELFIVARGNINRKPLEIVFVHPYNVQTIGDANSIWPAKIYTNIPGDRKYYNKEVIKGRIRYIDDTKLNEIFPYVSERSEGSSSDFFRGTSPLTSLKDELLGYAASVVSNKNAVENSGRPSGVISLESDDLTGEQRKDITKSVEEASMGYMNSGKMMLIPAKVKAAFPAWTPKDMDYKEQKADVKRNIWNLYSIPLPIVSPDGQKFSNFSEAQTAFYDEAVNEVWTILSDALKWVLGTRYDMDNLVISYNQFEVPALKRRAIQGGVDMDKTNAFSTNEIRGSMGEENVKDGDEIMIPSAKVPLSSAVSAADFSELVK